MQTNFIRPDTTRELNGTEIQENKNVLYEEVESLKTGSYSHVNCPTYKTVWQFSISEVFGLFGLKKSLLFRLSQASYATCLPRLIVIYCNSLVLNKDDNPTIIEDKLYISHDYFKEWIACADNEVFESEMLDLIIQRLETEVIFSH